MVNPAGLDRATTPGGCRRLPVIVIVTVVLIQSGVLGGRTGAVDSASSALILGSI